MQVILDKDSFMITAYMGSVASLLYSMILNTSAYWNCIKVIDKYREEYKSVMIVFIDEWSFISIEYLQNLDKKLRLLRKRNKPYNGVSIVFTGDFYQLKSIKVPIYKEPHIFMAQSSEEGYDA